MVIHLSILFVIIFVSILWENGTRKIKTKHFNYIMPLLPFLIIFGYIAFLAAMRSGMNDTSLYRDSFIDISGTFSDIGNIIAGEGKDKGFDILANLFKMFISNNYHVWFALFSVVESFCFIYILRRESVSLLDSCFFFFASALYYNYFSMMRQWFAVALFFFSFKYMKQKRFVPYLIICMLAAQIHTSAYICIPIYFLVHDKPFGKKQLIYACLIAVVLFALNPLLRTFENSDSTYSYVFNTMSQGSGSSPIRILISGVPILISFFYRKQIANINSKSLNISLNISMINFVLNILATFTSGLYIIRMATYFNTFNLILMPYLLERVIDGKNKQIIKYGFFICYILFYFYQMSYQSAWGYGSDILGYY